MSIDAETEIRKLKSGHILGLVQILEISNSWKHLMEIIPKYLDSDQNILKYTTDQIKLIESASIKRGREATAILLEEWGSSGRKRPCLRHLLHLLIKAQLYRAADYVATLLGKPPPERPQSGPAAKITFRDLNPEPSSNSDNNEMGNLVNQFSYPSCLSNEGEITSNTYQHNADISQNTQSTYLHSDINSSESYPLAQQSFNLIEFSSSQNDGPAFSTLLNNNITEFSSEIQNTTDNNNVENIPDSVNMFVAQQINSENLNIENYFSSEIQNTTDNNEVYTLNSNQSVHVSQNANESFLSPAFSSLLNINSNGDILNNVQSDVNEYSTSNSLHESNIQQETNETPALSSLMNANSEHEIEMSENTTDSNIYNASNLVGEFDIQQSGRNDPAFSTLLNINSSEHSYEVENSTNVNDDNNLNGVPAISILLNSEIITNEELNNTDTFSSVSLSNNIQEFRKKNITHIYSSTSSNNYSNENIEPHLNISLGENINSSRNTLNQDIPDIQITSSELPNFDIIQSTSTLNSSNFLPNFSVLKFDEDSSTTNLKHSDSRINCNSPLPNLSLNTILPHISYNELEYSTNNFDETLYTPNVNNVGRKLGSGAFGSVYLAIGLTSNPIAVKKLNLNGVEVVDVDDTITKQFRNEVELLYKYKHDNLLSLIGYSCDGPTYCLLYEYISGGSLKDKLQFSSELLNWRDRLNIAYGTAKAISYLHSAYKTPLIHRDIKSANILLDCSNKPKLCDFGLIKATPNQNTSTATTVFGTSAYMSTEAMRGDVSVKMDTYSFGVVLLELLTSLPPIDESRDGNDLVTHVEDQCEDSISALLDLRAGSWVAGHINYADKMYEIANLCLEEKKHRPIMPVVCESFKDLLEKE